ncbi:MAG: DsbA family protein [Paracoccaceae bacterium]|nr:DsbA family protein [Paracoccaceae bacterium]
MSQKPVIQHFSDVLCVWAYVAHIRFERLVEKFSDQVDFETHYCPVFPDARGKISRNWEGRGGFHGYAAHVDTVACKFDHVKLNPDAWSKVQPASSTPVHLLLKAAELVELENGTAPDACLLDRPSYHLSWQLRRAFFEEASDIASWEVQRECVETVGLDYGAVQGSFMDGSAFAALDRDVLAAQKASVTGSPTFVMNNGRQVMYGNVGFHLLEANVLELLRSPGPEEASWC